MVIGPRLTDRLYDPAALRVRSERTLLCRLSVFPGGWTLEAAEEVCAGNGIEKEIMLDFLSHLVNKSLVNVEDDALGQRRYRCLETVRQYGRERVVRSGDAERVWDSHLGFFFTLVRRADPELIRADQNHLVRMSFVPRCRKAEPCR